MPFPPASLHRRAPQCREVMKCMYHAPTSLTTYIGIALQKRYRCTQQPCLIVHAFVYYRKKSLHFCWYLSCYQNYVRNFNKTMNNNKKRNTCLTAYCTYSLPLIFQRLDLVLMKMVWKRKIRRERVRSILMSLPF